MIEVSSERFAGVTRVCKRAFCSSAFAFLAFTSLDIAGSVARGRGLMSPACGKVGSGRRLRCGSSGFASTLAMNIAAKVVARIPSAR